MTSAAAPHLVEDCAGIRLFSDGSVVRLPEPAFPSAPRQHPSVEWKDLPFGPPDHGLHLRLFRPKLPAASGQKFPVLFYFHGGGFVLGSCTWPNFHDCALRLAADLQTLVVSPDYRLAPEHRLPAALLDAIAAVNWLETHSESEPWLAESADLAHVFVSGESAGANIGHHLALRFGSRIRGYILLMPFFTGTEPTRSEAECPAEAFLTVERADQFWRLALPAGATRDDPVANPFGPGAADLGAAEFGPMTVVVGEKDMLRDRGVEYATRLKDMGKKVELVELKGKEHGFFAMNSWSEEAGELVRVIGRFVKENSGGGSS